MKIVVIGTRGIPNILGGVETHCEELYPRLARLGHDITIIRRSSYVTENNKCHEYKGVKLIDIYTPKRKSVEAIIHTTLAVIKARGLRPDILHIHSIGPSLLTPLARLLGMKVVTTNHGPDYDRQKWNRMAKMALKAGEYMGARWSNAVIVISDVIANILNTKYNRKDTHLIFNGVNIPDKSRHTDFLDTLGIIPGKYILAIGRFVKEKGFHDLITAYTSIKDSGYQLVIAGDADHEDEYSRQLKQTAKDNGVILTGFIKGERLNQIMSNAALFVLPSYHEGLPIALLEAMSYNLDVVVSDIPANRIDALAPADFFPVGDTHALASLMARKLNDVATPRTYDLTPYNWDNIARQTQLVYEEVLGINHLKN